MAKAARKTDEQRLKELQAKIERNKAIADAKKKRDEATAALKKLRGK